MTDGGNVEHSASGKKKAETCKTLRHPDMIDEVEEKVEEAYIQKKEEGMNTEQILLITE